MTDDGRDLDLPAMRRAYAQPPLRRVDLAATWHEQLALWVTEAAERGQPEPNAMVLATASEDARPSTRTVLLKGLAPDGLRFFTNYGSRKGRELGRNRRCSATFSWTAIGRQVTVEGEAERLSVAESQEYFARRPWGARLGAIASPQSRPVSSRDELERRFAYAAALNPEDGPVRCPHDWGGFLLRPACVEFWQGRPDRMHDRLRFVRSADRGWFVERLGP